MTPMTPARKRLALLFVAVGIGLIVERVIAFGGTDDAAAAPIARSRGEPVADAPAATGTRAEAAPRSPGLPRLALDRLADRAVAAVAEPAPPIRDTLFAVRSWEPAAAAPAPPAPPPAPVAPPFPYPYIGGLTEEGRRTAFFTRGDRVLPVHTGDTVDAVFRVDTLDENQMTMTYLPLNQTVALAFGGGR